MKREARSAEEIQAEVDRLLNEGRKVRLAVPLPMPLIDRDPLEGDANWQMPRFPGTKGNEVAIGKAIMAVKVKWDLRT